MTARLALLPDGPRRALALAMVLTSLAIPAALIWISAASLAERWAARAALEAEVSALAAALEDRQAARPAGAGVSPDIAAADAALIRRADALVRAFEAEGAAVLSRAEARTRTSQGLAERRLTLTAAGAPDALAAALASAAADRELAVAAAEWTAPRPGTVQVRLVLVELIAEGESG
jgi:hypothetical protein